MNRRDVLKLLAAVAATPGFTLAADARKKQPLGLVIHSYWIRRSRPLALDFGSVAKPLEFLEAAAKLGAAGVQTKIDVAEDSELAKLRDAAARHKLYLEGIISLPKDDAEVARFDAELRAAKQAGIRVLRTACLSGRRYETFSKTEQFQQFAEQSWESLTLAEPLAAGHRVKLAVENHKDWRIDEMLGWLKRLSSEFVGVCLDTGNSIALLEEPHSVVEAFAPWTISTHFKDMAVTESDDGFLLSEVPLGDGFLELKRVIATLRKARPDIRLNLEMITRDPLRVPCLSEKYWATMGHVPARELASAMSWIRRVKSENPLPVVSTLSHAEQLQREAANIARCLMFAAERLSETTG